MERRWSLADGAGKTREPRHRRKQHPVGQTASTDTNSKWTDMLVLLQELP